ncbi:MAG: hypothetical protein ABMA13_10460 [Chthoniobacteraceae bacterium]
MSTLAEIEKAVPQLTATELAELERFVREMRVKQAGAVPALARPWMELAGCLAGESDELRRVDRLVEAEFESVNPDDWR